jgi:hypothetical protein
MRLRCAFFRASLVALIALALAASLRAAGSASAPDALARKVDAWVLDTASRGDTEFLVMLRAQADLRERGTIARKDEKGAFVMDALRSQAEATQSPLRELLESRGVAFRPYWVANMIWVRGGRELVEELAARDDVFHVYANPKVAALAPRRAGRPRAPTRPTRSSGTSRRCTRPRSGRSATPGQNVVVGGQDTGYQWDHPALKNKYRGWLGGFPNHNYNWHDAIHSGGGSCGADSAVSRATTSATARTRWARWSATTAARTRSASRPARSGSDAATWTRAPERPRRTASASSGSSRRPNSGGTNPDPTKAPHVINNSWGCTIGEGCTDPNALLTRRPEHARRGIEVVVSAGTAAPPAAPVTEPAAIYDESFSVGATDSSDEIAGFSSADR